MTTSLPDEHPDLPRRLSTPALLWRGALDAFLPLVCWFLALTALGVAAGALFVGVHGDGGWLTNLDGHANRWFGLHHVSPTVTIAKGAAVAASVGGLALICVAIGAALWWAGWRVRAFVPLAAFAGAEAVVYIVKEVIERHRPATAAAPHLYSWVSGVHETDYSFPSGHTTATAAVVVALAILAVGRGARGWPWVVALLVAAAMGAGRLVLGVHWFSDVFVGFVVGCLWGAAVATMMHEPDEDARIARRPVPG